jgi:membrane protein implicated in regulation of membrane protease activity
VDPLVTAAGQLQGTIAVWVHQHGAWPWIVAVAVVLVAAGAATVWQGRRAARQRQDKQDQQDKEDKAVEQFSES